MTANIANIAITENAGILEILFDRPERKNALTASMYQAMTAELEDAARRPDIAVVLLAGRGDSFCAGNDLSDFMAGPEGMESALAFTKTLARFDKPVVAAVQGAAVGIGTTMLLHCDLIYASPDARFIVPFVNLGLVPEAGSSLLLPAIIGHAKAAAMLLLGEPMIAQDAEQNGLVTAIVAAETLVDHARAKAAALAASPQAAVMTTLRLLRHDESSLLDRMDKEAELFQEALGSVEAQCAFQAFFARQPNTSS